MILSLFLIPLAASIEDPCSWGEAQEKRKLLRTFLRGGAVLPSGWSFGVMERWDGRVPPQSRCVRRWWAVGTLHPSSLPRGTGRPLRARFSVARKASSEYPGPRRKFRLVNSKREPNLNYNWMYSDLFSDGHYGVIRGTRPS